MMEKVLSYGILFFAIFCLGYFLREAIEILSLPGMTKEEYEEIEAQVRRENELRMDNHGGSLNPHFVHDITAIRGPVRVPND